MDVPFSRAQFFEVFAEYNVAVWPAQLVLVALALACVAALFLQRGWERGIGWALAALWAWMGVAYHWAFFAAINPVAWTFGAAFLLQAFLLARHAASGELRFPRPKGFTRLAVLCLLAYALLGYPLAGGLAGHQYPHAPTFGLPCPTTIFTLGLLASVRLPGPRSLLAIPVLWSLIGSSAALKFGVVQDYGLLPAAALGVLTVALRSRRPVEPALSPTAKVEQRAAS